jgi:hypothetical protein
VTSLDQLCCIDEVLNDTMPFEKTHLVGVYKLRHIWLEAHCHPFDAEFGDTIL